MGSGKVLFCTYPVRVVLERYRFAACYGTRKLTSVLPRECVALSVVVAEGIADGIVGDGSSVVSCKQVRP